MCALPGVKEKELNQTIQTEKLSAAQLGATTNKMKMAPTRGTTGPPSAETVTF